MMSDRGYRLDGDTALITGGGGLLGVEHAAALLECGARVVLADIDEPRLKDAEARLRDAYPCGDVLTRKMDVRELESVKAVAEELAETGGVQVLVNNAAIDPKVRSDAAGMEFSRLENFPLEAWDFELAVGLTGAFVCSQVFGTRMASSRGGRILNIASDLSVISPDQRLYRRDDRNEDEQPVKPVTYSVIKTGLVGLTRYLAGYWAHKGVRVNALSPGGVQQGQDPEFVARITDLIPMGRMAERHEYRGAVQFLCSDASRYMTGQNIVMDGGRSIL